MSTAKDKPKLILDTDPGGDDILALLWLTSLVKQGLADLVAVTTTAGNVSAQRTFSNASQILTLVGLPAVELGRGVEPYGHLAQDATHIHGTDGMGNLSTMLPPVQHNFTQARLSSDIIIDWLQHCPGEVTIIAIGPLTNMAAVEHSHPGLLQQARELVIMAGAFQCSGNVTPQAEFNAWFNPEALQAILQHYRQIVVVPLDVTRHLIFTPAMAQKLCKSQPNHPLAQFLQHLCHFMVTTAMAYRETGGQAGFLVHDAATIGYLFYPETLLLRRSQVDVETQGEHTRGQTLIDQRHQAKIRANAWVALQVDTTTFFSVLLADLQWLLQLD